MKTTKHNLSLDDWQHYKSGQAGNHFEKTLSGDDMNYLAAKGFEKTNMGSADVNELMKRIDAKTFSAVNLNAIFIGGIVVVAFVSLFFFITKTDKNNSFSEVKVPQTTATPDHAINTLVVPEVNSDSSAENKKQEHWHKEHFSIKNPEQPYQQEEIKTEKELVDMSVNPVTSLSIENNTFVNLDQLPNAPIIYIKGFTITNFHIYYFKNQKFQLVNGGIDPQYDDVNSYKANRKEMKEGDKTTADEVVREAIDYFSKEKYTACIADFDLLLKINKDDVNAFFYSGMSFYYLQKNDKAIEFFDKVLASENNIFHQEAEFYKANALLAQGEIFDAKEILKKIVDSKGFYAVRAAALLKTK